MASEPVHPLRIAKKTPNSSPTNMSNSLPRPLSEISPTEKRRNSPSWRQYTPTKKAATPGNDSSPFHSSPLEPAPSPRLFWQNRNAENMLPAGGTASLSSPTRRSSIERLQRASRVRNSNILALEQKQEYDTIRLPHIERPLAKIQGNVYSSPSPSSSGGLLSSDSEQRGLDSKSSLSTMSPSKASPSLSPNAPVAPRAPSRDQVSPTKSSLSPSKLNKGAFDPEFSTWSGRSSFNEHQLPEGRLLHRHPKSVTFDAAPPQINEYEMATPDLSSVGTNSLEGSYESADDDEDDDEDVLYHPTHTDAQDDSFDEVLEDTEKTPVVGPDDWRREDPIMHPGVGHELLEASPIPEAALSRAILHQRPGSANSNGDHRPLPPLPGLGHIRSQSASPAPASPGLSATAERMLGGGSHRSLPVPPPASASKSDIQSFGHGRMTLEERLKLIMLSDNGTAKSIAEKQRARRLKRVNSRECGDTPHSESESVDAHEEEDQGHDVGDPPLLDQFYMPPRISRESIMRRVNGNESLALDSGLTLSSPVDIGASRGIADASLLTYRALDPDVPIPTTEDPVMHEAYSHDNEDDGDGDDDGDEGSVIITRDFNDVDEDDVIDYYQNMGDKEGDSEMPNADDESHYSNNEMAKDMSQSHDVATPRAGTPAQHFDGKASIPDFAPLVLAQPLLAPKSSCSEMGHVTTGADEVGSEVDFGDSPSQKVPLSAERPCTPLPSTSKADYDGSGWGDPENKFEDDPSTPDSVIRHPLPDDDGAQDSPAIPERIATIKSASGSKLKTRVSNTPSDLAAMREARRQVSIEVPAVSPIPERHRNGNSHDFSASKPDVVSEDVLTRRSSFKNRSLTLDLDMGLSLDQDFERVIEAQKRGYLMRQNTKLVTASDKDADTFWKARSANNSPVKHDCLQSWIIESWNGESRPRSPRKCPGTSTGPVPPLPGQESNAATYSHISEEYTHSEATTIDPVERGRLFVKVMGVKDLDLPLTKNERTWFSLTLDNGVHCVTTAWLELARNAPIGQEFELVVPNDLEFQLTLNVKLDKPVKIEVPMTAVKAPKPKPSAFRVFASPRKRREMEMRQKAEEERFSQQQREALARRNNAPTAYELLSPLTAADGSFGRSYVCLKEHEGRCFGRPYTAEVVLFNEWVTEEEGFVSSVKSKRGNATVVRRAPYQIGKLELQLLFVPRPKNSKDEDMPKSMNACLRELRAAEERLARNWEGHLSQQGGDCPYWRRRYFKLVGTKLTAYHETTRQPRATINLCNAKRLMDDHRSLSERDASGKQSKRRRSAFSEEEEGYMFVEEGFRIRFNNGEVIDFYADTAEDKNAWMRALSDVMGRGGSGADEDSSSGGVRSRAKWCELVLKREEHLRRRSEGRRGHMRAKSSLS